MSAEITCKLCGKVVPQIAQRGRKRRYCSDGCGVAANVHNSAMASRLARLEELAAKLEAENMLLRAAVKKKGGGK